MKPNGIRKMTPEEFLAFERASDIKHEYRDGEIFAMSGAKRGHNIIALNVGSELHQQLKDKDCETYLSDMRVFVPATRLYTYPDIVTVCGEPVFQDDVPDTLVNPVLLIEILSDSTENYDRGLKFQFYRSISTLREYVLISQTTARIEKYVKHGDGFWLFSEAIGLESIIEFASIDCKIPLADIYNKVEFPNE